jgi:hypothetical protein
MRTSIWMAASIALLLFLTGAAAQSDPFKDLDQAEA